MQDKFGLIADSLYLTVGSKFEANDLTGFEYQPNARLTYYPSRNQTIWAAVSRAIRTPTRGEDNLKIRATPTIIAQQGSNTYRAEDVLAYELGYRVKPTEKTTLDISSFYNKYSRLRTFDAVNGSGNLVTTPNGGTPTANNNGYGETYGFEIDAKWQVLDIWRLEASYDMLKTSLHLNSVSNENNNTLLNSDPLERSEGYSPRSQFRIRSLLNLTPKLEFDNLVFYTNSLTTAGPSAAVFNAAAGSANYSTGVKPYTRWDTRLGYLINRNLDVSFGIQNILSSGHQEFKSGLFTAPSGADISRTYYMKAVLQF